MTRPVGRRTETLRETVVAISLIEGEVDDMTKLYGVAVFAPRRVRILYRSTDGGEWEMGQVIVRGPQRLKSGKVSAERWHDSDLWRRDHMPSWVIDLVSAHEPAPVASDDLPIQPEAVEL